jgi:hypothetical protein
MPMRQRVAKEIEVQVDPTYQDLTVKQRRAKARAKKAAEAQAQTQKAPVVATPAQIDHPHGTRSKKAPLRNFFPAACHCPE